MSFAPAPRIALIHALEESIEPTRAAFCRQWPEADAFDLLDTGLSIDRARHGSTQEIEARITALADYAVQRASADALLFTCSAFGWAIDAVAATATIPVLKPNEAAFRAAVAEAHHIALLVTFEPSRNSLADELEAVAARAGRRIEVVPAVVTGALDALQSGDPARHDSLIAEASMAFGDCDVIVLGQFSMARAARAVRAVSATRTITTPDAAVRALQARLQNDRKANSQ